MGKKLLEGKSGEAGFIHDTPEQISKCLSCDKPGCFNCFDTKEQFDREIDYDRPLQANDLAVLSCYASCETDMDICEKTGLSKSTVFLIRKHLGLPSAWQLTEFDRKSYVDLWLKK